MPGCAGRYLSSFLGVMACRVISYVGRLYTSSIPRSKVLSYIPIAPLLATLYLLLGDISNQIMLLQIPMSSLLNLMLNILHSRHLIQPHADKHRYHLNTLLHKIHILHANAQPPHSAQVPRSSQCQVLDHDSGEHNEFGREAVEDAVVG